MSMKFRYHVIPDRVGTGVTILDSETGVIQYPACWQDLAAFYYYLVERGRVEEAQKLLADSMAGSKPITNMLVSMSSPQSANSSSC